MIKALLLVGVLLSSRAVFAPTITSMPSCAADPAANTNCVMLIVQSPTTLVFLMGMTTAAADALPPTNVDGSANQAAQDAAVNDIVFYGSKDGMYTVPSGVTLAQVQQVARSLVAIAAQNQGLVVSPGMMLRALDTIIVGATSNGTVSQVQVMGGVSTLVNSMMASGLAKTSSSVSLAQVEQFTFDTCATIEVYKQATGKTHL